MKECTDHNSEGVSGKTETESTTETNFLDDIKEAALNCQNHTDFVFEPTSGLYYDTKTGYYYNAVCQHYIDSILCEIMNELFMLIVLY